MWIVVREFEVFTADSEKICRRGVLDTKSWKWPRVSLKQELNPRYLVFVNVRIHKEVHIPVRFYTKRSGKRECYGSVTNDVADGPYRHVSGTLYMLKGQLAIID